MTGKDLTSRKWFYPVVYGFLIVLSMLPPITQVAYDPRDTQDVIASILMASLVPYRSWGWVFHVATLAVVALAVFRPQVAGRVMAAFFGVNYLLIAAVQTNAVTEKLDVPQVVFPVAVSSFTFNPFFPQDANPLQNRHCFSA